MERIFTFDELSTEKQRNVREAYNRPNLGAIALVIDDTAFRGCRDGLILTENFLATKKIFQEPDYYPLEDLRSIECINKSLVINGVSRYKFTLVEQDELDAFVAIFNKASPEESGKRNDNDSSAQRDEDTDNQMNVLAGTDVREGNPQGFKEFIELKRIFHEIFEVLINKVSDQQTRAQITAQRQFIFEIMRLCAGCHDTLSREAQKLSEEDNLFQYDLCCYLPALTYAAAYIEHLLEQEAGYNYHQLVRYVQFPFLIMEFICDTHPVKRNSKGSIATAARKNSNTNKSAAFKECEDRYSVFVDYFNDNVLFGYNYLFFAADLPWIAHLYEDDKALVEIKHRKAMDLREDDGFVDLVENRLAIFEKDIKIALLAILQEYGPHDQVPHDLNTSKPPHLRFSTNTEGMRKRV